MPQDPALAPSKIRIIIVMGVSGSGKSTLGERLAAALGWAFLDADTLHPKANIAKMSRAEPLSDADRWPWLQAVRQRMRQTLEHHAGCVVACSALKASYRRVLAAPDVHFVFLDVPPEALAERLRARAGHFMPQRLLASQLEALEPPDETEAIYLLATQTPERLVQEVKEALRAKGLIDDL